MTKKKSSVAGGGREREREPLCTSYGTNKVLDFLNYVLWIIEEKQNNNYYFSIIIIIFLQGVFLLFLVSCFCYRLRWHHCSSTIWSSLWYDCWLNLMESFSGESAEDTEDKLCITLCFRQWSSIKQRYPVTTKFI